MTRTQHVVSSLAVVLDLPDGPPAALVVCAHGLTGDKSGPADLLARWAADLAAAGIAVVRFDFRGSGDSSGRFAATTFTGMVEDFASVWDWARARMRGVPAIAAGISTGGVVATAASAGLAGLTGLLLLSSDLLDGLGDPPVTAFAMRTGEFHLGRKLLADRENWPVRPVVAALPVPVRLIHGDQDGEVVANVPGLRQLGVDVVRIEGCGHLIETREARAELATGSIEFVRTVTESAVAVGGTR